jgi:hypothetical protein
LEEFPDMPATVIAERIGWSNSLTVLKDRVRVLRPQYKPVDPVSRTSYAPGELAQCDLSFPPAKVPVGAGQMASPPVLVMVSGYSRWLMTRMLPARAGGTCSPGCWRCCACWVPSRRRGVEQRERDRAVEGRPQLTAEANAFRGVLGVAICQCKPADPEAKGLVERANGYLETSFLPGRPSGEEEASPSPIPTEEGWLYLATVIHIASRRVVGWATADHLRTDLVADALKAACQQRRPTRPVIFHTDRGCQYTSRQFAVAPVACGSKKRPLRRGRFHAGGALQLLVKEHAPAADDGNDLANDGKDHANVGEDAASEEAESEPDRATKDTEDCYSGADAFLPRADRHTGLLFFFVTRRDRP